MIGPGAERRAYHGAGRVVDHGRDRVVVGQRSGQGHDAHLADVPDEGRQHTNDLPWVFRTAPPESPLKAAADMMMARPCTITFELERGGAGR